MRKKFFNLCKILRFGGCLLLLSYICWLKLPDSGSEVKYVQNWAHLSSLKNLVYLQSGLYQFMLMQSLPADQKPMHDLSGPSIDNYKSFTWQDVGGKLSSPHQTCSAACGIAVSKGSCSQGLSLPWWPTLLHLFLAQVPPFTGPSAMAFPSVSTKTSLLRGMG